MRKKVAIGVGVGLGLLSGLTAPARADDFTLQNQFGTLGALSMAWGDFDNDGDLDLAVGNCCSRQLELYVNNGNGTFTQQLGFGAGNNFAVAWADYDNDGDLDLAVGRQGQCWLFVNNGNATFTRQNQFGNARVAALAWADYDLDGDLDMAVGAGIVGTPQQNFLYINNGDGTFTAQPQFGTGRTDTVVWGDFNNDGYPDLAVGNGGFVADEQNFLYINNGGGTFTERAEFGGNDTASMAWGDADNDGDLDLAVGNWNGGASYLYVNNGDGTFMQTLNFGTRDTNCVSWADFDLDGDLDLAAANGDFTSADQNYLYVNDGFGNFTEEPQFGLGSTDSIAWADFDGDGDLDAAIGNEHTPAQNSLAINNLNATTFVRFKLVGQFHAKGRGFSNRDGVGAKVTIYTAGHAGETGHIRGHQEREAHGGFSPQNAPDLTFGVGGETQVDAVVHWPGSRGKAIKQVFKNIAAGTTLTVTETGDGDMNCDGVLDFFDLDPFVQAILDPDAYAASYPDCNLNLADVNGDGVVDFFDLDPFIAALLG